MAEIAPGGRLLVSVDLELDVAQRTRIDSRRWDAVATKLIELLGRFQIPATWAVADPARSAATEAILHSQVGHEVAILGDSTWVGRSAGRARFARELARRVEGARHIGLPATTLVLRGAELDGQLDLLVKQRVSAIRSEPNLGQLTPGLREPQLLRFGIWQMPASCLVPSNGGWFLGGGWIARRIIQRAVRSASVVHLLVDAPSLLHAEAAGFGLLERTLEFAVSCCQRQGLQIQTLGACAALLTQPREVTPARSILRAA